MCMRISHPTEAISEDIRNAGQPDDVLRGYKVYLRASRNLHSPYRAYSEPHFGGIIRGPGEQVSSRDVLPLTSVEKISRQVRRGFHVLRTRAAAEAYKAWLTGHYNRSSHYVVVPVAYRRKDVVAYGTGDHPDINTIPMAVVTTMTISARAFNKAVQPPG